MYWVARYCAWLLLSLLTHCLLSCSTPGPKPRPLTPIVYPNKLSIIWSKGHLENSPAFQFVPVLDDNAIFTADAKGNIFKIDRTDGTVITHFRLRRELSSGTAVSSDSIYVTSKSGYLFSVNKVTGKIKWRAHLPTIAVEAPQISGRIVLVKTNDADVLAYAADSGSLLWIYQKPIPRLTLRVNDSFAVMDKEVAAIGQPGGRLALINITNGNPIWENYIAIAEGATDLDKLTDVSVRPILYDKTICAATFNGNIACLDAISSNVIWSKSFSANYGILTDAQNVYAINVEGVIFAFARNTGESVWSNDVLRYRSLAPPVFLGDNIVLIDSEGFINLFKSNDGKLVARVASNLRGGVSYPIVDENKIYAQSASGEIAKITIDK